VSLDDALSLRSASAGSRTREERDDRFRPILPPGAAAGRPQMSKLERIKSSGSVIDKPSLIRTISKMEDVLLASQLNPLPARVVRLGQRAMANDAEDDDDNDDDDGGLDSPRTVHGNDGDAPMTPTGEACNILAALQLSREAEGLFASVVSMFVSSPRDPITPVSKDGNDDDASSSTPMTSSPGSEASFVSSSISAAVAKPSLAKRNTCGTIYLGSTLSAPDKDALIKCVCGVFRAHMLMGAELRGGGGAVILGDDPLHPDSHFNEPSSSSSFREDDTKHAIFNDRRSPGDYRLLNTSSIPSLEAVTDYYRSIFLRSQMEVECIIISLIYVERLVKMTNGKLIPRPENWRSVLFSCMVLASKVWDDLSMWNCDFSKIGPSGMTFTLSRTNELEIELLRTLRYSVKVEASEYAKYYFLLRCMLCRSGLANDDLKLLRPLDVGGASNLLDVPAPATDGGGELSAAACATKPLMMQRSKTHGCAYSSDENGAMSSQGSPMLNRVNLERIVRMQ